MDDRATHEGIAPRIRMAAMHLRGPKRSTSGPRTTRMSKVAQSATTGESDELFIVNALFELLIWAALRPRSARMASGISGGKANHEKKATKTALSAAHSARTHSRASSGGSCARRRT